MRHLAILLACLVASLDASQSPTSAPPSGTGRISGRVLTSSGGPVEGATVSTFYFTQQPRAEYRYDATSGADAGYQFECLPAGTFRVVARKQGYSGMTTQPGQINEGAVVTLEAGAGVSGIGFSVSGAIVDGEGQTPRNPRLRYGSATSFSGGSDAAPAGQFTVRGVRNGPVHLLASANGDAGNLVGFATVNVQGASITEARVVVGSPARVTGRLIANGATLPDYSGVRVAFDLPWPRSGTDDGSLVAPDGSFSMAGVVGPRVVRVSGLPPRWDVKEVRRAGSALPDARLTLANGQVVDDLEVVIAARN